MNANTNAHAKTKETCSWKDVQQELKERFTGWCDSDLEGWEGGLDELATRIHEKTGESKEAVQEYLACLSDEGQLTEMLRERAREAAQVLKDQAAQASDTMREQKERLAKGVQQRPMESLAVCFGTGLVAGTVIGLLLRGRS